MQILPRLTRFDLSVIVVSFVLGMGIFATPAQVARNVTDVWLYFGAWLLGGIISLCGALTFAEIGSRYPSTGGFYKSFSFCFHPMVAFMINWILVISNAASVAAVATIGAEYIAPLIWPAAGGVGVKFIAFCSVTALYLTNIAGIKIGARTQNLLIIVKVLIVLVLCVAGFMLNSSEFVEQQPAIHNFSFEGLGAGLVLILFTYGGYQQTINFGGDSINPQKHIPKAIFTGMLVVIAMYMLLNIAYVYALGMNGMQANTALAAALAGDVFGKAGSTIVSVLMFVSVLAFINVNIMANPRVYYAMADDGMLPARFKEVNSATQVQEFGLSFFTAAILITLFFVNSLEKTISYVMFFDAIGLSTAALSIFILRKKTAHLNGTGIYTIKWFPLVPIIFIIAYWFILVFIFIKNPFAAIICIGIFVLGLIIYLINKRNRKPITTP